ncbi:MAG: DNA polymerase/3'-5' exonuclease PolX [Planctomycetota bacterium]|nr:DNA polymerase/3'-5' exonuclease PolX [Planctomycetota bacterium]
MTNDQIADVLDQVADLLEFEGANPFRIRAYRGGSRVVRELTESVAAIVVDDSRKLTDLAGIGKDLAEKITTLIETGRLPFLDELLARIPESVLSLLRIPGLGPKKAAVLYRELEIVSLEQLRAACESGAVRALKGFAAKTEQAILAGIDLAASANERIYWSKAEEIVNSLLTHMRGAKGISQMEIAGSFRRGRETVGDLDLLVDAGDSAPIMDRFGEFEGIAEIIARGDTKMSVRLESGLSIDLRVVPTESFGAAWQYFTGSKAHNVHLRGMAKKQKLKINEYGVFRGEKQIAGTSEAEVYAALGLPHFPPELREDRQEFQWAAEGDLPKLVQLKDIRGDLHMHTTATDGKNSLEEMVEAAVERGLSYIAITDHSQRVTMAHGLDPERLLVQWKRIDALNKDVNIDVLKGIECDILEKGGLDLPDDVLAQADYVVCSIHYGQNQPQTQITDRVIEAIEHPYTTAIAHPTGRLIGRRKPYAVDLAAVISKAVEHKKLLELNANPARLDLDDIACAAVKAEGGLVVISTDAHKTKGLDSMRYGVLQARRAGLTKSDVANTKTWKQLQKYLGGQGTKKPGGKK